MTNVPGSSNKGIVNGTAEDLIMMKYPTMPSIITESAFLSNTADRTRLQSPEFCQNVASAIANGIIQFFG
jgi:N-acetylmuramoyl-L-alanine amidase